MTMTFFLSAGCLAQVDKNKLANLTQEIKNIMEKGITGMYSVAVSISDEKKNPYKIKEKFLPSEEDLKNINNGQIYSSKRVVVAKPHGGNHAEWRVLEELEKKLDQNQFEGGDLLVIFTYASSCDEHCAKVGGEFNIIDKISNIKNRNKWTKYAFVFEKVFKPTRGPNIEEDTLKTALKNIGNSIGSLANIFRCYKPKNTDAFKCLSCSKGKGKVVKQCVDYDA